MSNGISAAMSNGSALTATPCQIKAPLVVTMVGQPFRGKSLSARKIARNLFWKGENVEGMCPSNLIQLIAVIG